MAASKQLKRGEPITADSAISVSGLRKSYGSLEAVRGVDLEVTEGEVFALLGPNGAGKTTIVEILEGYRDRDSGEVQVLGHDPQNDDSDLKSRIGIVLQSTGMDPYLTVAETLSLFGGYYPNPRSPEEIMELVGLTDKADVRVTKLSGGQQRRLDVGVGLAGDPDLLFLDEPTTGFDPGARRSAWDMIKALAATGKTIFLTTHFMDEAQYLADRVAIIAQGVIIAEGPPETLAGRDLGATVIRFKLSDKTTLPAPVLATATEAGEFLEFSTSNPVYFLHELTGWALAHGLSLEGLEVNRPSLEDIYLQLTQPEEATAAEEIEEAS
ncbi:MAG TPA: ABC transporter ATP-binding protein [Actinomycetota bacterium]|nr:ABC transporter ATP-binding protein [Actinomycetota bacterium]